MLELYVYKSTNSQRAAIALEEAGLPYVTRTVDLVKGEQRKPDYLALNPAGAVPVLVESGEGGGAPLTLAQSGAILFYAAERSGRLLPDDPVQRAAALQWTMLALTDAGCASAMIFLLGTFAPEKSPANIGWLRERLQRYLVLCDERLRQREYLADTFSIADIALYPIAAAQDAAIEAAGLQALKRWAAAMAARRGVQRGMKAAS